MCPQLLWPSALLCAHNRAVVASSARLTALPSSTPWLIPNWRTHTLQGVLLVFVLINDLSLLSYSYFSSQSSGFMTGAKDKKALKKPQFSVKIYGQKSPLQHTDIQWCSDVFFESSERGQKNIAIIELKYRDNWSQISRYFFRLERTCWEVRPFVLRKTSVWLTDLPIYGFTDWFTDLVDLTDLFTDLRMYRFSSR